MKNHAAARREETPLSSDVPSAISDELKELTEGKKMGVRAAMQRGPVEESLYDIAARVEAFREQYRGYGD